MGTSAERALVAVKGYAASMGTHEVDFGNTPLHYSIADLVSGLMLLAKSEGVDFRAVLKDAKESADETEADAGPKLSHSDRLREFFGKICNKENWKMAIDAVIEEKDERLATDAIVFMTGGGDILIKQTAAQKKKGLVRIQAPGYYEIIGM